MISQEDNNLLTKTNRGMAMGAMLRRYWVPLVRVESLVADGPPKRLRVMGDAFVVFRATDGRVGVFDEACPHRCASLGLARNEENGLRCIFHGLKIDVSGKVVDIPTEPEETRERLASKITVNHYPVREAGGIVWAYLDRASEPPRFPDFEFTHLPDAHIHVLAARLNVNWLQAMESVLDSAHLGILHRSSVAGSRSRTAQNSSGMWVRSTAPRFEFQTTPYGFREAALRQGPDGLINTRIRSVVAPWHVFLPGEPDGERQIVTTIPVDDEHCHQFFITYNPHAPFTAEDISGIWYDTDPNADDIAANIPHSDQNWGQDREAMKQGHFSGITNRHVFYEDFAVLESMGPIVDRTQENLTQIDATVIRARKHLIRSARAFAEEGAAPWGLERDATTDYAGIRTIAINIAAELDWQGIDGHNYPAQSQHAAE